MADFKDTDDLFARVVEQYMAEDYTGAYELATAGLQQFPDERNFVQSLRAMLAVRVGEQDTAYSILREVIDERGYWYGGRFWQDEDFDGIRDEPEFVRLRAISDERLKAAQAAVKPELATFDPPAPSPGVPLLMALHGNSSSVFWHKDHWQPATAQGWLVALPQSSQLEGHDANDEYVYSWDHEPTVDQEIRAHYAALDGRFAGDRVVVAGFSRGAENAVRLALQGVIPARGFIAVCPGGPYSREPELWDAVIKTGRSVRGWVIIGGKDHFGEGTNALIDKLRAAGMAVEVSVYDDMGHDYPPDFQARLPEMLAFVSK